MRRRDELLGEGALASRGSPLKCSVAPVAGGALRPENIYAALCELVAAKFRAAGCCTGYPVEALGNQCLRITLSEPGPWQTNTTSTSPIR